MSAASGSALALAMQVSPTAEVQTAFIELHWAIEAEGSDSTLSIVSAIADGLRHGNWPERELK